MTNNGLQSNEPRPRLCHLRRWPNFVGYGFNLHCEKSKPGQYIGKVDPNSPAESAGLREHDRIVEVNFVPIGNENHKQVVSRIKEGVTRNGVKYSEEVILLVLDPDADIYYKTKSVVVRSTDPNVQKFETEHRDDGEDDNHSTPSSNRSATDTNRQTPPVALTNEPNQGYKYVTDFTGPTVTQTTKNGDNSPTVSRSSDEDYDRAVTKGNYFQSSSANRDKIQQDEPTSADSSSSKSPRKDFQVKAPAPEAPRTSPSQSSSTNLSSGVLELQMSAAEYREKLKAQYSKKRDPRQEQQMSMKQKHELIDRL